MLILRLMLYLPLKRVGNDIMYREGGQPTRILVLDKNGIVDFDSYNDLSEYGFLKRNLRNEYPIIDDLLQGKNIDPTPVYWQRANWAKMGIVFLCSYCSEDQEIIKGSYFIYFSFQI